MHVAMIPPSPKKKRYSALVGLLVVLLIAAGICFRLAFPGPLTLDGAKVMDRTLQLSLEVPGIVAAVPVEKGQFVPSGATLVALNAREYTATLKEAEAQLAALEALLPAGHSARNATSSMSTEENLQRLQAEEIRARKELTAASEAQAQAAVAKARRQALYHKNRLSRRDYEAAVESYNALEGALGESRLRLERASNARAGAERELSRIRQVQQQSGIDAVPAEARVKAYEAQLANVELAAANLAAATLTAPSDGVVVDISVAEGQAVSAGQTIMAFRPSSPVSAMVAGILDADKAANIRTGQACEVVIPSFDDKMHAGQVTAVVPGEGNKAEIHVLVNTGAANATAPAEPGATATVRFLD